jgi:hypothetical protein
LVSLLPLFATRLTAAEKGNSMEKKDKKKIIAGAAVLVGTGLAALFGRRKKEEEVPPGEDYGRVQGYVLDEETGAKIANAEILVDDVFNTYADHHGLYRTGWIRFGSHTIIVKASNYETACFSIALAEGLMDLDLQLLPMAEAPTEWTEGVEIQKIVVEPSTAYVGEPVEIRVYIQYLHPRPVPADIQGSILVDGVKLTGEWTIDQRNPTLRFSYTPNHSGDYTVRAQDKSANFTVSSDIRGTYYNPFGAVRIPVCTEITIPDVPPFNITLGPKFEGGDYKISGRILFLMPDVAVLKDRLASAYPTAWDPPEAAVREWLIGGGEKRFPNQYSILVMATVYDCPPYWYSREELAQSIVGYTGYGVRIPSRWILEYGETCPVCNGTGITDKCQTCRGTGKVDGGTCPVCHGTGLRKGGAGTCWNCDGLGKVLNVDLVHGWKDLKREIKFYSTCGGGKCIPRIYCPYCGEKIVGASYTIALPWDALSFIRKFLNHIETVHPDHPLTAPAWY